MSNTYYVDGLVGNDSNSGIAPGSGNAWATIDNAMNRVQGGDKVWVKGSVNYNELAIIDTKGSGNAPIVFEGYTSTSGDNGFATMDGESSISFCVQTSFYGEDDREFYVFKNFRFTNTNGNGVECNNNCIFKNCKFDNNGSAGLQCGNVLCENCEFSDNGGQGCGTFGISVVVGCKAHNNTYGFYAFGGSLIVLYSELLNNDYGIRGYSNNNSFPITIAVGCTIDGYGRNEGAGANAGIMLGEGPGKFMAMIVNNVVLNCIAGFYNATDNEGELIISRNNLLYNNDDNYVGLQTFTGEILTDPIFNNAPSGDYRPGIGSSLKGAGYDCNFIEGFSGGLDIGALQSSYESHLIKII